MPNFTKTLKDIKAIVETDTLSPHGLKVTLNSYDNLKALLPGNELLSSLLKSKLLTVNYERQDGSTGTFSSVKEYEEFEASIGSHPIKKLTCRFASPAASFILESPKADFSSILEEFAPKNDEQLTSSLTTSTSSSINHSLPGIDKKNSGEASTIDRKSANERLLILSAKNKRTANKEIHTDDIDEDLIFKMDDLDYTGYPKEELNDLEDFENCCAFPKLALYLNRNLNLRNSDKIINSLMKILGGPKELSLKQIVAVINRAREVSGQPKDFNDDHILRFISRIIKGIDKGIANDVNERNRIINDQFSENLKKVNAKVEADINPPGGLNVTLDSYDKLEKVLPEHMISSLLESRYLTVTYERQDGSTGTFSSVKEYDDFKKSIASNPSNPIKEITSQFNARAAYTIYEYPSADFSNVLKELSAHQKRVEHLKQLNPDLDFIESIKQISRNSSTHRPG